MELGQIRTRWNDVLDAVLACDRIAWLAFFDARLADFDGQILTLDFSGRTSNLVALFRFVSTLTFVR